MPNRTDNPSEAAWKEFAPLQPGAPKSDPQKQGAGVRTRGGCQFCKSQRFLRSSLRAADIGSLFFLRYPVRCLRCRQRQFKDFLTASFCQAAGSPVYSQARKRENWSAWTSRSDREIAKVVDKLHSREKSDARPGSE